MNISSSSEPTFPVARPLAAHKLSFVLSGTERRHVRNHRSKCRRNPKVLTRFGKTPTNENGNLEPRLAEVKKNKKSYSVKFLDGEFDKDKARVLVNGFRPNLERNEAQNASLKAARETVRRVRKQEFHILAQRARLGHYIGRRDSRIAHYINLTDASWVQESHSPFGEPTEKNEKLRDFFRQAFSGEPAEEGLRYRAEWNWYEVKR